MDHKQQCEQQVPEKPAPSGFFKAFKSLLDWIAKGQAKRAACGG